MIMRGRRSGVAGLWLAWLLLSAPPAWAHRHDALTAVPADAIAIPNLSHGQMVAVAANRAAILDLAARQVPTDRVMRRLQGFISIQFSACLWGLVPGSLGDEASPFNECTHAHLAATLALLLHLRAMPGDRTAAEALAAGLELEMMRNSASLVLCRYSDEPFNTAEVIRPDWREVPSHPASLATLLLVLLAVAGLAGTAAASLRLPLAPGNQASRPDR